MTALRAGLPALPPRMAKLPIDARGYPVPWFVKWIEGKPDFRVIEFEHFARALRFGNCWICGEHVGVFKTFVLGPMCTISRTTSEPPCHHDCASFAAMACPFMILPRANRRLANLPANKIEAAGIHLPRNPGAFALWTTSSFKPFRVPSNGESNPGVLLTVGDPSSVEWYAAGARCGREPVMESIDSGFHHLWTVAKTEGIEAQIELENAYAKVCALYLP